MIGATDGDVAPRLVLDIPSHPEEVASARHAVVEFLAGQGVPTVVLDDMELVTSELVTNAIVHPASAAGPVRLEVEASDKVTIAVSNVGSISAIPPIEQWRPAPPFALSGRGLGIVRRLCDEVSVRQVADRAVVACVRRLPDGGGLP